MSAIINRKRQRLSSNSNQFSYNSTNNNNNSNNNNINSNNNNNSNSGHSQSSDSISTTVAISNVTPSSSATTSFNYSKKRSIQSNIVTLDSEDDEYDFKSMGSNPHSNIHTQNNNTNEYQFGVDYEYEDYDDDDDDEDEEDEDDEDNSSLNFFSRTSSDSSSSSFQSSGLQFLSKFSKHPPSFDFLSKKLLPNNSSSIPPNSLKLKQSQQYLNNFHNQQPLLNYHPKKRTKSLPQLSYSKLNYEPLNSRRLILQKVNEVKTTVIPYNNNSNNNIQHNNYVYGNDHYIDRKLSFNNPFEQSNLLYNDYQSTFEEVIEEESEICDDKNGHYNIQSGSSFANNRFILNSLLGQGTFGKVVQAYDKMYNKTVAIKIIKAIPKYREASKIELRVLSMLKKHDPNNIYQCIHFRECFDYRDHICIVTEILQKSLYDFLDENQFLSFPGSHIQAIAKQLIRSVTFLHDLNIIHTDLKPENILLKDDRYICKDYQRPNSDEITQRKILVDPKIYTIDFGSAIFDDEYHSDLVSTRHYRAPEIILGIGWSYPCDIWSLGCILVELITGEALFKTHENPQHLAMMEKLLGKPIDIKVVFECFNKFYNSKSSSSLSNKNRRKSSIASTSSANSDANSIDIIDCFNRQTGKLKFPLSFTSDKLINEVNELPNLCDLIGNKLGFRFNLNYSFEESVLRFNVSKRDYYTYEFWYYLLDLIFKMLCYNPKDRITAYDALKHHWFKLGIFDDGTV